jgi:hypothetical protein
LKKSYNSASDGFVKEVSLTPLLLTVGKGRAMGCWDFSRTHEEQPIIKWFGDGGFASFSLSAQIMQLRQSCIHLRTYKYINTHIYRKPETIENAND